jgi:GNAT superfamily N-acetyltransferase
MRASEFITEEVNPDCFNPAFNDTQIFDGLTYRASMDKDHLGKKYFEVKVFDDNFERVGLVKFKPYKNAKGEYWLESLITAIHPDYRGKGIARNVYAYVRMLGNNIKPSNDQTDQGRAMWNAWKQTGDAEHLVKEQREDFEGITIEMKKQGYQLVVKALDDWGNKELGHVTFNIGDSNELDPQDLEVDEKYQGQGIARVMYDYVKSKGYEIHRSWDQTDAGAGFWNKHRGEDVRVWEE